MIRFYLVCFPYWIFVDYIFVRLNLTYLPANNLRRISTMYVRGYLQGSENGPSSYDCIESRVFAQTEKKDFLKIRANAISPLKISVDVYDLPINRLHHTF